MTPEMWAKLAKVFHQALEQPEAQRDAFVTSVCSDDPDLGRELKSLLYADKLAARFLDTPAVAQFGSSPSQSQNPALSEGELLLNRFEIIRPLGRGGMGQVFEAFDRELQEKIAIKVLNPEISMHTESMNRFRKEVQFTRRVTHPNVCRTFDLEQCLPAERGLETTTTTLVFLTMELLQGETLASYMSREGPVPTAQALPIAEQIIAGLEAAHRAGVVHRDLKPSNVIIIQGTHGVRAVVTDFGIAIACLPEAGQLKAIVTTDSVAYSDRLVGTLEYMAPEQLERGEATPASDVYAFGLVLYELVTNKKPFQSDAPFAAILDRLKNKPISPRKYAPDLNSRWESTILRCLEKRPESRFKTAGEILPALRQTGPPRFSSWTWLRGAANDGQVRLGWIRRRRLFAVLATFFLVVALSAVAIRLFSMYGEHPTIARGSTLMLTEITNDSRDPELNSITELFRNQLEQSSYMNLLPATDIREALDRMALPKNAAITPSIAREVALRKAVPLVIFGTVSKISDDYALDLKLERIGSHPFYAATSWTFSKLAPDKKSFFDVIHEASIWIRSEAGEAHKEIIENDRKPEDVTTDNWEALKLYSDGQRLAADDRLADAILLYKEAASKDPQFSMALMRAGDTLDTLGQSDEGMRFWTKALAVRGLRHLTPREELRIKGMFANDVGDLRSAIDAFGQYSLIYPDDYLGYFYRAYPLMLIGRTEEAVEMLRKAETLAPNSYYIADHLARYSLILGDLSATEGYLNIERKLGKAQNADMIEGQRRFLLGDHDAAKTYFTNLQSSADQFIQSSSFNLLASVFAEEGRYGKAIQILRQGIAIDAKDGATADQARKLLALAYIYSKQGNFTQSRETLLTSIALEPSPRQVGDVATLLARIGSVKDAEQILATLKTKPPNSLINVISLRIRGELLLAKGQNREALTILDDWRKLNQERSLLQDSWAHATYKSGLNEECLNETNGMLQKPGQIWHQAETYFPGYLTDLRWLHAKTMAKLNRPEAEEGLAEYLDARRLGDSDLPDLREARAFADEVRRSKTRLNP
jgi:eukaryotic-like serine/threonine-protein kinase